MRWHWLRLRATAHPTEDVERVREAVRRLAGLELDRFAAATQETKVESHHGATITLIETTVTRAKEIREALGRLVPEPAVLAGAIEARTDDDGVLYLRFDKQAALGGGVVATVGEDAVQVRLKPEVHPAGRDRSVAALREWASA